MILGIDYGKVKLGIALVNDSKGSPAVPLTVIRNTSNFESVKRIKSIQREYSITHIVVGNPYIRHTGSMTDVNSYNTFISMLKKNINIPISLYEEYLSTQAAKTLQKNLGTTKNKDDDSIAAQLILQSYIDSKYHESPS